MGETSEKLPGKKAVWWSPFRRFRWLGRQLSRSKKAVKITPPTNQDPAAIKKMRNESGELDTDDPNFIAAVNYIMDEDAAKGLKTIIEHSIGTVDKAVPCLLKSETFDDFLSHAGLALVIDEAVKDNHQYNRLMSAGSSFGVPAHNNPLEYDLATFVVASNKTIYMNRAAHWHFDSSYKTFKEQQEVT
jgi:hypothetical protein